MKVIVVASQIGGGGKTTLVSHLAVEAERCGTGPVVLIDTDPKGGLAMWWNERQAKTPLFTMPLPGGLGRKLQALEECGVQFVFIDTPPEVGPVIAATIDFADLVLIPVRPSPIDLLFISDTVSLIEARSKPMLFVINCVKPWARLTWQMATALSAHGTVAGQHIADHSTYAAAMIDGRSAPELEPDRHAAREIAALWDCANLYLNERRSMKQPAQLSSIADVVADPISKGGAVSMPPPEQPARFLWRSFEETPRSAGRVQVSARITPELYDRLRRISYDLRAPIQTLIEVSLKYWMDDLDAS